MLKLLFSIAIFMLAILFTPYFGYTDKVTLFLAEFYSEHWASDTLGEPKVKLIHQGVALPVKPITDEGESPQPVQSKGVQNFELEK